MPVRRPIFDWTDILFLVVVFSFFFMGCPHPSPTPNPPPSDLGTVVCDAGIANFDQISNEVVNAAQDQDDAAAFLALDAIARKRGHDIIVCVIGEILPDLREAPTTKVHLQAWCARGK